MIQAPPTSITAEVAAFAATLSFDALPADVTLRTGALLLDLIGSIVRARFESDSTPALLGMVDRLGLGNGPAHVFGDAATYSFAGAALINGMLGHSLDFDDTHAAAILHPAAAVIPAALSAAEMVGAAGSLAVAGIVAGYEVALRLSLALPAGRHYDMGFHPSATCGAFGAAAAAGRILGLSPDQMASAFGIALSQAAGSLQFLANGAWTKRFQVGWASHAGLVAATLASEGLVGAADAIDGKHGFLRSYSNACVPMRVTEDLGSVFELMNTGVKPYPSCRWGHAGIDAALRLRDELALQPDEIEEVRLGLSRAGMLLIGEPADKKSAPSNTVEAQFSGPFVLAAALATGQVDWDSFKLVHDTGLQSLMRRIACYHEPDIEREFPEHMAGLLTIRARGSTFVRKVIDPSGEPQTFPGEDQMLSKFQSLVGDRMDTQDATHLARSALAIGHLPNVAHLFAGGDARC